MLVADIVYFLKNLGDGVTSNATRQAARTEVINRIGVEMYMANRPIDAGGPIALSLFRVGNRRYFDLPGECALVDGIVQVDVWGRGPGIGKQVEDAAEYVRQSLIDYQGTMNSTTIRAVTILRDGMSLPIPPDDASDGWTYVYSTDYEVAHIQTTPNP